MAVLRAKGLAEKIDARINKDDIWEAMNDDMIDKYFAGYHDEQGFIKICHMCGISSIEQFSNITKRQLMEIVNIAKKNVDEQDVKNFYLDRYKYYAKLAFHELHEAAFDTRTGSIGVAVTYNSNTYEDVLIGDDCVEEYEDVIVQSVVDNCFEKRYNNDYKDEFFEMFEIIIEDIIDNHIDVVTGHLDDDFLDAIVSKIGKKTASRSCRRIRK